MNAELKVQGILVVLITGMMALIVIFSAASLSNTLASVAMGSLLTIAASIFVGPLVDTLRRRGRGGSLGRALVWELRQVARHLEKWGNGLTTQPEAPLETLMAARTPLDLSVYASSQDRLGDLPEEVGPNVVDIYKRLEPYSHQVAADMLENVLGAVGGARPTSDEFKDHLHDLGKQARQVANELESSTSWGIGGKSKKPRNPRKRGQSHFWRSPER